MALTKTTAVVADSITLTAGAGDTTGSAVDLTACYDAALDVKITNGATGPTVAAQVQIQHSPDNSNWYNLGGALKGSTTNAAVVSWALIPLGPDVRYIRHVSGSNTGQNVTLRIEVSKLIGV